MCKEIADQLCKVALAFKTTQAYTFVCYSNGQILNTIFILLVARDHQYRQGE